MTNQLNAEQLEAEQAMERDYDQLKRLAERRLTDEDRAMPLGDWINLMDAGFIGHGFNLPVPLDELSPATERALAWLVERAA